MAIQPDQLSKFSLGLGIAALAAKGLLIWSVGRLSDFSDAPLENQISEMIDPANNLASVAAFIGLTIALVVLAKGTRGQLLYASLAFKGVALFANPMAFVIN